MEKGVKMSAMPPMGAAMRSLRTDRSVVDQKLTRRTLRRIFGFAKPHGRLLAAFVFLVVVDAVLGVGSGYLSSRIGENLIFDLRTKVFGHVQRMSLAFFTRTQTGAIV